MSYIGWVGRQMGLMCMFGALATVFMVGTGATTDGEVPDEPTKEAHAKVSKSKLPPQILAL